MATYLNLTRVDIPRRVSNPTYPPLLSDNLRTLARTAIRARQPNFNNTDNTNNTKMADTDKHAAAQQAVDILHEISTILVRSTASFS
jgi:hypothetical protein